MLLGNYNVSHDSLILFWDTVLERIISGVIKVGEEDEFVPSLVIEL